ncbi:MAG: hypothetical protein ACK4U0_00740 [Mesorhizobium sp.]
MHPPGEGEPDPVEDAISFWWGISPPHRAALAFAREVRAIPAAFARLEPSAFEAEPADFSAALERFADPVDPT